MSLVRAAFVRQNKAALVALPRRSASSSSVAEHEHHDEHHHEDTTVYPPETFISKPWRNLLFVTLGGLAFYKFAPTPDKDTFFGEVLSHYKPSAQVWTEVNAHHLTKSVDNQTENLIITSAQRPQIHRYRFPQALQQHSGVVQPVGMSVDISDVVVKTDRQ